MWDVMQDRVYQKPVRDVADLGDPRQHLTDICNGLSQNIVDGDE